MTLLQTLPFVGFGLGTLFGLFSWLIPDEFSRVKFLALGISIASNLFGVLTMVAS